MSTYDQNFASNVSRFVALLDAAKARGMKGTIVDRLTKAVNDGIMDYPEYPEGFDRWLKDTAIECGVGSFKTAKSAYEVSVDVTLHPRYVVLLKVLLRAKGYKLEKLES